MKNQKVGLAIGAAWVIGLVATATGAHAASVSSVSADTLTTDVVVVASYEVAKTLTTVTSVRFGFDDGERYIRYDGTISDGSSYYVKIVNEPANSSINETFDKCFQHATIAMSNTEKYQLYLYVDSPTCTTSADCSSSSSDSGITFTFGDAFSSTNFESTDFYCKLSLK
ncbi:MAG: hypothetical protein AAB425_03875 [Bdellovibrionota bacterium]